MKSASIGLVFAVLLAASAASADEATAKKLSAQGASALAKKDWAGALSAYQSAKQAGDSAGIELGLARALAGSGKILEAKDAYAAVGGLSPSKKVAGEAQSERAALDARLGTITVTVTPANADVAIDGVAAKAGQKTPVNPGDHVVSAKAAGFAAGSVKSNVAEGGSASATVTLTALGKITDAVAPGPTASTSDASSDGGATRRKYKTPAIIAYAVGGAGLIAGGVTGVLAIGKHSKLKTDCVQGHCAPSQKSNLDSYRTLGTLSTIGFAVAGAGLLVGTGFLVIGGKEPVSTSVWVGPTSAGVTGSF